MYPSPSGPGEGSEYPACSRFRMTLKLPLSFPGILMCDGSTSFSFVVLGHIYRAQQACPPWKALRR